MSFFIIEPIFISISIKTRIINLLITKVYRINNSFKYLISLTLSKFSINHNLVIYYRPKLTINMLKKRLLFVKLRVEILMKKNQD